ncbi:MAG TPA: N-acetylmuramidase domain-containing protein [Devosiaceae bacterium]|jgi:hypothetical protein|nr:N-acetylmuramidase domain-containing protein [Devosiaceae bacterium]
MIFDNEALAGIRSEAKRLGLEWQALAAVAEVESGGRPLWDGLCPIRIEGHYFDKRLSGALRARAREEGLAHPKSGMVKNPRTMAGRYEMLKRMMDIDGVAALESCSWGLGQVMGAHWSALKYMSADDLAEEAKGSVSGQIRLMGRFIEGSGLKPLLKARDWVEFARRYNGPGHAKNKYAPKMAAAYDRFMRGWSDEDQGDAGGGAIIERGSRGIAVEKLQERLAELNYYKGRIDGDFGGGTEAAVMDFQRDAGIQVDGRVGPVTLASLTGWSKPTGTKPGKSEQCEVVYKNQHAVRNRPVTPYLEVTLAAAVGAVYGPGFRAEIYSGGQPRKGMPGKRTGSVRHDDYGEGGRALDAWVVNKSGGRVTGPELARLGQYWLAKHYGGCGLEMAGGGIHLDEWKTPPKGGGMFWTYAYSDGQSWGSTVRQMLAQGKDGVMPKVQSA